MPHVKIQDTIANTLLIPLYFRAKDAQQAHPFLNDQFALNLSQHFEFDEKTLSKGTKSQAGIMARAKFLDEVAKNFIAQHSNPVIVNMACGLDTRSLRIYDEKAQFIDVDLPEVIALRRQYIPDKSTLIGTDIFSLDYIEQLNLHSNAQFCFIFEGVLMYFGLDKLLPLLQTIVQHFQGQLAGDFNLGNFWANNQQKHDTMGTDQAHFVTSFADIQDILYHIPQLKLIAHYPYHHKKFKQVFGWLRFLLKLHPARNAMQLLVFEFK